LLRKLGMIYFLDYSHSCIHQLCHFFYFSLWRLSLHGIFTSHITSWVQGMFKCYERLHLRFEKMSTRTMLIIHSPLLTIYKSTIFFPIKNMKLLTIHKKNNKGFVSLKIRYTLQNFQYVWFFQNKTWCALSVFYHESTCNVFKGIVNLKRLPMKNYGHRSFFFFNFDVVVVKFKFSFFI